VPAYRPGGVRHGGDVSLVCGSCAEREKAAKSSTPPLDWPVSHDADRSRTCPLTGPGRDTGSGCGTTRSDTAHQSRSDPDNPPDTALPTGQMLGCGELSGASRNRTCEVRVRGHARSVVAVGCRSRTAFTGGLAPELQPAVAVCGHRNDGIRDERRYEDRTHTRPRPPRIGAKKGASP
jgi:hypothetical protein